MWCMRKSRVIFPGIVKQPYFFCECCSVVPSFVTKVVYCYKCSRVHAREKEISQATMELESMPVNVDLSTYSCIVAQGGHKVYKDECVFCFNSPVSFKQLFYILLHSAFEKNHNKNNQEMIKQTKNVYFCDSPQIRHVRMCLQPELRIT